MTSPTIQHPYFRPIRALDFVKFCLGRTGPVGNCHVWRSDKHLSTHFQSNSRLISDYLDIANEFNTFFANVGPKLADEIDQSDIDFKTFLSEMIEHCFKELLKLIFVHL